MEKTWNTFWETGRIDDYLEICREKESDREQEVRQNGAEPCSDRNGFKCCSRGREEKSQHLPEGQENQTVSFWLRQILSPSGNLNFSRDVLHIQLPKCPSRIISGSLQQISTLPIMDFIFWNLQIIIVRKITMRQKC